MKSKDASAWVSCRAGARLTGLDSRHIRRLAQGGYIARRQLPGAARARTLYSKKDLLAIAESSVRPAAQSQGGDA